MLVEVLTNNYCQQNQQLYRIYILRWWMCNGPLAMHFVMYKLMLS